MCPSCLTLENKAKHPCFGAKTISRSKMFRPQDVITQDLPMCSNIYVPVEMRADMVAALQSILSARELNDDDQFTAGFYILAKLKRSCMACLAGPLTSTAMGDFHSCRLSIPAFVTKYTRSVCHLFNVQHTPDVIKFLTVFLEENTIE